MANFQIGQMVHATKMGSDSFYLEVKGCVTGIKNGFVEIQATEVKDRWTKKWEPHPTSCGTSCKIENAILIR